MGTTNKGSINRRTESHGIDSSLSSMSTGSSLLPSAYRSSSFNSVNDTQNKLLSSQAGANLRDLFQSSTSSVSIPSTSTSSSFSISSSNNSSIQENLPKLVINNDSSKSHSSFNNTLLETSSLNKKLIFQIEQLNNQHITFKSNHFMEINTLNDKIFTLTNDFKLERQNLLNQIDQLQKENFNLKQSQTSLQDKINDLSCNLETANVLRDTYKLKDINGFLSINETKRLGFQDIMKLSYQESIDLLKTLTIYSDSHFQYLQSHIAWTCKSFQIHEAFYIMIHQLVFLDDEDYDDSKLNKTLLANNLLRGTLSPDDKIKIMTNLNNFKNRVLEIQTRLNQEP